ncbi:MAG: quinol oxidase [Deltaproteobacteria bacterium]|nr:quinol oxidase [Deltaproteobacteria bacterium]
MRNGILAVVMLLAGCVAALADQAAEKRFVASVDSDGVQRVTMTGGEYYFDPGVVVVKVNVPVELRVKKAEGIAPHNIVLKAPEAGIDFAEELGSEVKVIGFTPTKTGNYAFECSKRFLFFESHKEKGMHGVLEVVQ